MQPPRVTVRNVSLSKAAEATIREKAAKLESFCDRITSCRVVVEAPTGVITRGCCTTCASIWPCRAGSWW